MHHLYIEMHMPIFQSSVSMIEHAPLRPVGFLGTPSFWAYKKRVALVSHSTGW